MTSQRMRIPSQADGLELSVLMTCPEGEVQGLVQIAHGMAEHKERYLPFMEALAKAGIACLINDHRGHGESAPTPKDLGWFGEKGAEALLQDLHQLTGVLREAFPCLPLCLFGHSMGSLAVRVYLQRWAADIDGLVVCGCPGYNPATDLGLALVRLLKKLKGERARSRLINALINGGFSGRFRGEGSPFAWLNSDPVAVAQYEKDPACGFLFTLNGYEALFTLIKCCYRGSGWQVPKPHMPVLFLSGADDPCMISRRRLLEAAELLRAVGYTDVSVNTYSGMRHEILLEPGRDLVVADLLRYLDKLLTPAGVL
jgi:alpha-beta hydrolase superfamily lysophospholipase